MAEAVGNTNCSVSSALYRRTLFKMHFLLLVYILVYILAGVNSMTSTLSGDSERTTSLSGQPLQMELTSSYQCVNMNFGDQEKQLSFGSVEFHIEAPQILKLKSYDT